MIEINGKTYYVDIEKISELIEVKNNSELYSVITETYEPMIITETTDVNVAEETIEETDWVVAKREIVKQPNQKTIDQTMFETITFFIRVIMETNNPEKENFENLLIGEKIALNTLLRYKILKQI